MPILLWVVFPFAVWSACMDQALSAQRSDMPKEFGGGNTFNASALTHPPKYP
jgi:hypothetical protein